MLPLNPFCLTPSSKTKLLLGKCYKWGPLWPLKPLPTPSIKL